VIGSLSWLEFLGRAIGTGLELRGGGLVCAAGSSVAGRARLFPTWNSRPLGLLRLNY